MAKQFLFNNTTELNPNQWDDLRVGATATQVPTVDPADFEQVGTSGLYLPRFSDGLSENLFFETQIPHSYKHGTDLNLHLHWIPDTTDTGNVNWVVYYQIQSINGTFNGTTSSDSGSDLRDAGDGTAYKHQITGTHAISGTGIVASACIFGVIRRVHDANDTYVGSPYLMSLDIHYLQNKIGSEVEIPT